MKAFLKDEYTRIKYSTLIGDSPFPLDCTILESGIMGADATLEVPHLKTSYSYLFFPLQGTISILSEDKQILLNTQNLYLFPSYHPCHMTYYSGSRVLYIHFTVQDISGLDIFRKTNGIRIIRMENPLHIAITKQYFDNSLMAKIQWQSSLFQLICSLITPQILSEIDKFHASRKYHKLLQHIQKNCTPRMTVAQLAENMNISRSALSKGFQRRMGFSLKSYFQQLLIQRACQMLIDSNDSIAEIAFKLGYADQYYFYRIFKKHMRETPLQYRKASIHAKLTAMT